MPAIPQLPINNTDVPRAYVGAWRKRSNIERAYWLQTARLHASLDIPIARPAFADRRAWGDFSDGELMQLALQGGVSGACIAQGDVLHRRRQIDYLPRRGDPYLRRMRVDGTLLQDASLDGRSGSTWERLADGSETVIALRFQDAGLGADSDDQRRGYLLVVDDYFMYVRDRVVATQRAESLATLADCKEYTREQLLDLLDFEISFGARSGAAPWRIALSTIPFREGRQLMSDAILHGIVAGAGQAPQRVRRDGKSFLRYWSLDQSAPE
jgi:hypothetical protein